MDYAALSSLRREILKTPELWQFDLLDAQGLLRYARDRSLQFFDGLTIRKLWGASLLRADLVRTQQPRTLPGITPLYQDSNGQWICCDERTVEHRAAGYGGVFQELDPDPLDEFEPLFHPFRIYVLHHIARVFQESISTTQFLLWPDGAAKIIQQHREHLDEWTSSASCADRFQHWNETAELAIVAEPAGYSRVFGTNYLSPASTDKVSFKAALSSLQAGLAKVIAGLQPTEIGERRAELGRTAQDIDANKMVHVLLRFMSPHERLKLRSALGTSMLLLCMSEMIRRTVEIATANQLPEEDELGYGRWMDGARRMIYGTDRIFDSTREVRRQFFTSMGIDAGIKTRCYVEGDTELGALDYAVVGAGVEFVNLSGQVAQRRGKGLAFIDSLENDKRHHIFSIVVLDGDVSENVRALRKAARDDRLFGRFFLSNPDIEFENFTVEELVAVLLELAASTGTTVPQRDELMNRVHDATSATEMFEALEGLGLGDKGVDWGRALMDYALRHPVFPESHRRSGQPRTIVEIAKQLLRAANSGYVRSVEGFRVDPETGNLIPRQC
jgi:hypothetical protein